MWETLFLCNKRLSVRECFTVYTHTHTHTHQAKLYSIVYYKRVFLLFFVFFWPTAQAILFILSHLTRPFSKLDISSTTNLRQFYIAIPCVVLQSVVCALSIQEKFLWPLSFGQVPKRRMKKKRNHTEGQRKRIEKYQPLYTISNPLHLPHI